MDKKNNFFLKLVLMAILSLDLYSCNDTKFINTCDDVQIMAFEQTDMCNPKIMSYHFGVENLPETDQVSTLFGLQMDGMILQIETSSLQKLEKYYQSCEVKSGEFNIYNIFTTISLDNPEELEKQLETVEVIYKEIQNKKTVLQIIFNGEKNNINTSIVISRIADIAKKYNKNLIIYPHEGNVIETAEEALDYIVTTNKENVFLSVHLCHELAAGNGGRIDEVIKNVAPYIKSVSISGATESEQFDNSLSLWFWAIKPLNKGTYDYTKFYKTLYEIDYQGPIAIHTWGILKNFGLAPKDHLPNSRDIILELASEVCM